MKKIIIFLLTISFYQSYSQHQHGAHVGNHPKSPFPALTNEQKKLLDGFDAPAVMRQAKAISSKPAEQQEYFEAMQRRYISAKAAEGAKISGRGNQAYSFDYDPASKTGFVNLTPYNAFCPNAGFENMDFSNWTGGTFTNSAAANWNTINPAWVNGIMTMGPNQLPQAQWPGFTNPYPNRHTIMTIPPTVNNPPTSCIGWDSIAILPATHLSEIEFVPPTANGVTARLGNANNNYNEAERLVYSMFVTPNNSQFNFSYAVVLYDGGHAAGEQPYFKITTRDQNGNPITGCGQYQIDATQVSTDPSFIAASYWSGSSWIDPTPGGFNSYYYKKWTNVAIDLTPYLNTTVSIEFQTGDCIFGGHWGYAYVDATCQPAQAVVNMCSGSASAILVAPPGYTSYQWYGPNGQILIPGATNDSLVISNAVVGNVYTVNMITAAGCTSQVQTTLVTTNISIQNTYSTPSCLTGFSGTASVVAVGSNNGYNYSWTNVSNGATVGTNNSQATGLAPGTYSLVVSSPNCGSADTTITVGISPPVYYTDVQNFCISPAQVVAPTGTNYVWYNSSGAVINGANSGSITVNNPVNNTNYTVVFTNPSGCKDSVKITLTQSVNTLTQNTTFCGTTANLCAPNGATNVVWYDANWPYASLGTTNCISIPNPVTNTWSPYYLSYTNPTTGCKDSVSIYLTNTPSAVYASNIVPTCLGQSTGSATINMISGAPPTYTLTITGPQNFTNNTAGSAQNLSNLPAGIYNMTFTDGQCTATGTFSIDTIFVNVTTNVAPDTICGGQSAVVTFNYGGGAPTQCAVAASGCGATTTQTVGTGVAQNTSTTWPSVYGNWYSNEKYQILYTAADLLAAGMTPGKISSISFNVASIPTGMNTTFLNYTIKIGCTNVADLDPTGTGFNVPFVTGVNQVIWGPQNYVVTAGWNTHNFISAYEWDGVSNIIVEICYNWVATSNYTTNAIMNLSATAYRSFIVYYSDVTAACPQTLANASYQQRPNTRFTTCQSVAVPSDFTYSWAPNLGVSGTPPTVNLNPSVSTTYTLSITSNFGSCVKQEIIPITVVNPFTLSMPASVTYCVNEPADTLTAITNPVGPTGSWSGPGMTNAGNNADGYFNPTSAGSGNWYVYYTAGGGGCTITDSVQLIVNPGANATINAAGPFCITDNAINLSAVTAGGVYSGSGITNPVSGTFSPATAGAGTTTIQYAVGGQCPDTGTLNIIVYPQPVISISSNLTEGCDPTNISFSSIVPAPGNGSAQWIFGDGFTGNSQNMIHTYSDTGQFTVTYIYTDANGCADTIINNNMIWIHPAVTAAFTANPNQTTIIDPTIQFVNQSVNSNIYYWQLTPDSSSTLTNPTWNYTDPGTYNIMLAASNQWGCADTAFNTVIVDPDVALYVPNAFTPGDENGLNDVLLPYISGIDLTTYKFEVYNRWGERIYQTTDVSKGWNGRKNNVGELVQIDVYVWKVYFKNDKNKSVSKVGHVTLLR